MPTSTIPLAEAAAAAEVSAREVAALLGVSEAAAWDLLNYSDEASACLSLRKLLQLSARLQVAVPSILTYPPAPVSEHLSLVQLASAVHSFRTRQQLSVPAFSELAGWDVQQFLSSPDAALDTWCLDTLVDVCQAAGLPWLVYLPARSEHSKPHPAVS